MSPHRRAVLAAPFAASLAVSAQAQEAWPTRPVRLIMPYAAGGPTDLMGRLLADGLSQRLGQRVVVENRTGAGGTIGASIVAKAPADGHTLLFNNVSHAGYRAIYPRLDFDPEADFVPVTVLAESPMVLLVPPNSPDRTLADFVARVRAQPGRFTYGTSGGGGALQFVALLLIRAAGLRMTEVSYRGSSVAVPDLAAGTLDMLYDAGLTGFAVARGGQARALVVSSAGRSAAAPDVPTVGESGFPEATFGVWQAVFAPRGTPEVVVGRLARESAAILAEPAMRARLLDLGVERILSLPPTEARDYVAREAAKWDAILREAGVQAG